MAQFNALSGAELKQIFLDTISKALDESGEFGENLAYPWVKWDYSIKFTSYPKYPVDSDLIQVAAGEQEQVQPNLIDPETPLEERTFASSEPIVIDTPDQARVDADLPLPTPVPVVNVGMVDRPVKQQQAFKKGK